MNKKLSYCVIKCDEKFKKQCLSQHNSYSCKVRYFNGRCLMAMKENQKNEKDGVK